MKRYGIAFERLDNLPGRLVYELETRRPIAMFFDLEEKTGIADAEEFVKSKESK